MSGRYRDAAPPAAGIGTIPRLLARSAARCPDAAALSWPGPEGTRSITYGALASLVERLGASLAAGGFGPGKTAALLAPNGPDWVIAYLAATSCGGAIVPLDTQLAGEDARRLVEHAGASVLFLGSGLAPAHPPLTGEPGIRTIVVGGDGDHPGSLAAAAADGERRLASGDRRFPERRDAVRDGDAAAICYTSGTTGAPKGVVLEHRNIVFDVEACIRRIPFRGSDTFLCILPLYHTYAATANLLAPLAVGARVFFGRSVKSRDIREDVQRERVTVILGVPILFERMAQGFEKRTGELPATRRLLFAAAARALEALGSAAGRNLAVRAFRRQREAAGIGSVRFCISGAAALRDETDRVLSRLGLPVLQGYGMTEAAPVISVNPLDRPRRGTLGPPLPGIEVRLRDANEDGVGEIVVRGPNVMRGYLKNPAATAGAFEDGWLLTGDLGTIDADGYIAFVGRLKSIIVTGGGKNVYPDEIEARLDARPCILESIVLAVRDRRGNERVGAIVVPDLEAIAAMPGARAGDDAVGEIVAAEVRAACAELPEYKRIVEWRIRREELPKTSTRKIKRHLVRWPDGGKDGA